MLIDETGRMIADGSSGLLNDRPSIFSYLCSEGDRNLLKNTMCLVRESRARSIYLTFCYIDKTVNCLCHIYKGNQGYLITGWELPDNIHSLERYISA